MEPEPYGNNNGSFRGRASGPEAARPAAIPIFYFDRSGRNFEAILDLYRHGTLHISGQTCAMTTKNDLEFWGLDEYLLEPCCAVR